jgi:hypothetical protein
VEAAWNDGLVAYAAAIRQAAHLQDHHVSSFSVFALDRATELQILERWMRDVEMMAICSRLVAKTQAGFGTDFLPGRHGFREIQVNISSPARLSAGYSEVSVAIRTAKFALEFRTDGQMLGGPAIVDRLLAAGMQGNRSVLLSVPPFGPSEEWSAWWWWGFDPVR